jgi:hypothetical protein
VGEKRNCEALSKIGEIISSLSLHNQTISIHQGNAADVVMIGGKHYFLTFQEVSKIDKILIIVSSFF